MKISNIRNPEKLNFDEAFYGWLNIDENSKSDPFYDDDPIFELLDKQ